MAVATSPSTYSARRPCVKPAGTLMEWDYAVQNLEPRCPMTIQTSHSTFFGRPRFSLPAGTSQSCSLHFGQRTGRPSMRFTQTWAHRRHSQIMLLGIGTSAIMIGYFSIDVKKAIMID